MKNIQSIISNLTQNRFKKLSTINIINKLILTLPKALRKNILFVSIKNDTLLIATKHIGTCVEINNFRSNDILNAINLILDSAKNGTLHCDCANLASDLETLKTIKKVKAYVPKNLLEHKESTQNISVIYYKERAKGDFIISEDSAFRDIFEAIKIAIKKNLDNELKR